MQHKTAIIDEGCLIGEDTRIWHWSHVCKGARIGNNCTIGQNVYIAGSAVIGNNVKIQNNVSVYDGVILEDDVFCGPSMVFTNISNPRSAFPRRDQYSSTIIKKGATLGANCTIICGITIGEHAFIGAGAVITQDVPAFGLMMGNPARQSGWMSRYGERLPLPLTGQDKVICPHTGDVYLLNNKTCRCERNHDCGNQP
ncbi:MAG: acyltransferase [Desulfocapsaceae bacterium]|nr:acyltransferase [Desulfocapsaceae bacterium]